MLLRSRSEQFERHVRDVYEFRQRYMEVVTTLRNYIQFTSSKFRANAVDEVV